MIIKRHGLLPSAALVLVIALSGCGGTPQEGLFWGKYGVINTSDPRFNAYYAQHRDNDSGYIPPRGYVPPHPQPQPPRYIPQQPTPFNPDDVLDRYYSNPTDNDSSYVPPRQVQKPFNPDDVLDRYYSNPTDNDSSYVPPQQAPTYPSGNDNSLANSGKPSSPDNNTYRDNDAEWYPMIYDY